MKKKGKTVSRQNKPKKHSEWKVAIAIVVPICMVFAMVAVFGYHQYAQLPHKRVEKSEVAAFFDTKYQEASEILASYGITGEFQIDEAEFYADGTCYDIRQYMTLEDGSTLMLSFSWDEYRFADVFIRLDGAPCSEREQSWISPHDIPYLYALAAHFGAPKYNAEKLESLTTTLFDKARRDELPQSPTATYIGVREDCKLKAWPFELGDISYSNEEVYGASPTVYSTSIGMSDYLYW